MPHKDPEQAAAQKRKDGLKGYYRLRITLLITYGNQCQNCGITDIRVLVLDHINGGGEKERKTVSMMKAYRLALLPENHHKYQLLCHNCNHLKRIRNCEDIRKP